MHWDVRALPSLCTHAHIYMQTLLIYLFFCIYITLFINCFLFRCNGKCACILVKAVHADRVTVTATWNNLTATTDVSSHVHLSIHSLDRDVLVTPLAAYTIRFTGGPRPHPASVGQHIRTMIAEKRDAITVSPVGEGDPTAFAVLCLQVHCQQLKIRVGNEGNQATFSTPVVEEATMSYCCQHPTHIVARLDIEVKSVLENSLCLVQQGAVFPVRVQEDLPVAAIAYYNTRSFTNATTLKFSWTTSRSDTTLSQSRTDSSHAVVSLSG